MAAPAEIFFFSTALLVAGFLYLRLRGGAEALEEDDSECKAKSSKGKKRLTRKASFMSDRAVIRAAFDEEADAEGYISLEKVAPIFEALGIRVSPVQVREMVRAAQMFSRSRSNGLRFGEFCLFLQTLLEADQILPKSSKRRVAASRTPSPLPLSAKHQVFLGGSCNPTTWRKDHAIPVLSEENITYYNPQVDEWSPELVEIEEHAKNGADLLFFVIDDQTRGVASMVEVGYLAGTRRDLVVVINELVNGIYIDGLALSEKERCDLNRGRDILCNLLQQQNVPLYEELPIALSHVVSLINKSGFVPNPRAVTAPNVRKYHFVTPLCIILSTFSQYDAQKRGKLSLAEARLAIKSLADLVVDTATIFDIVGGEVPLVDFDQFCFIICALQSHKSSLSKPMFTLWPFPSFAKTEEVAESARDVFLGGSCGRAALWRENIVIPLLRKHGLSFFNPNVENWTERLLPLEDECKRSSRVLFFVIEGTATSIGSLIEAAFFIGAGREVVLCVNNIEKDAVIDGLVLTDRQLKDWNRGRAYLVDMASRNGVRVFTHVAEATHDLIERCKSVSDN